MLITCLSGLSFHARKWKIKDRRKLHDRRLAKAGGLFLEMLKAVATEIEDPGPYAGQAQFQKGSPPDFRLVSIADVMDALVQVRRASLDTMVFTEPCSRCNKNVPVEFQLSKLPRHAPSETGLVHLQGGDSVGFTAEDTTLGDVEVRVRALLGQDMANIVRWASSKDQEPGVAEDALNCLHIVEVRPQSGTAEVVTGMKDILEFYGDQDFAVQDELSDAIEDLTGGIDTAIDEECPHCHVENVFDVPFDLRFFYPKRPKKQRRRSGISSMRLT